MVCLVKLCLEIFYYYGRLTGVLNFEVDFKTGRTLVTKRATICAAGSHLFIFITLIYLQINIHVFGRNWKYINSLHKYVLMVISGIRMVCVFLALVNRWSRRRSFIRLFKEFRSLYRHNPEIIQFCRRSIISKCFCVMILDALCVIVTLLLVQNQPDISVTLFFWAIFGQSAIINVIISQYFIAMASIRGRYVLLNRDLKAIVVETQSLIPNRGGVFVTRCCCLADRLEKIACDQSNLRNLIEELSKAYQGQVACMVITYSLNSVGILYMLFSCKKNADILDNVSLTVIVFGIANVVFYQLDCFLNSQNVFYLLDANENMGALLSQRTLFQPGLDNRLEMEFETFTLNLARNPLKLGSLGLFKIDRLSVFVLGCSLITYSMLLMQYDIEHF